ncbi:hypothetical protein BH10CYA1_BH10CYA1_24480 [soil metagenome]
MDRLKSQNLQPEGQPDELTKGSADTRISQTTESQNRERIGKYEVINEIGRGGMSIVYKARDQDLNRLVAIKLMISNSSKRENLNLLRFQQEARAVSQLDHPNIVKVHDFSTTDDGTPYLVMSYLSGISLADAIKTEGNFSLGRWLSIMIQACDALAHAHLAGIVHRDIKPSNFVLAQENGVEVLKLVDFGIAKNYLDDMSLTKTGEVFGSPLYMSPEQCAGAKVDSRSDIYSLGCVMYEALAGKPPISGANSLETLQKHLTDKPDSLSKLKLQTENIQNLDPIVMRCLAKSPDDRYQNLEDLKTALEELQKGQNTTKPSALRVPVVVACVVSSLAVFAALLIFNRGNNAQHSLSSSSENQMVSNMGGEASISQQTELGKLRADYTKLWRHDAFPYALETAEKGARLAKEMQLPPFYQARFHILQARCEKKMHRPVASSEHYDEAIALMANPKLSTDYETKFHALMDYADVVVSTGAFDRAKELARQAADIAVQQKNKQQQSQSLKFQGAWSLKQKKLAECLDYYKQARKLNPEDEELARWIKIAESTK